VEKHISGSFLKGQGEEKGVKRGNDELFLQGTDAETRKKGSRAKGAGKWRGKVGTEVGRGARGSRKSEQEGGPCVAGIGINYV